jgi:hypothetical protein
MNIPTNADVRGRHIEVVDPVGLHHVLLIDDEGVWGHENLAHFMPEDVPMVRQHVIEEVVSAIARGDKDLPHGFHLA